MSIQKSVELCCGLYYMAHLWMCNVVIRKNMENTFSEETIIMAHKFSHSNYNMLSKDAVCGCFFCCKIFSPAEIKDWINDKNGKTAVCPYCGIDSIIGESSGYPITDGFLSSMSTHWF